jgi:hypothetical protein
MNKIISVLTLLVLCACGSPSQKEIGLTYNDIVVYYGAPVNETTVNGKRVSTWIEHSGIHYWRVTRVFDSSDKCISVTEN